MEHCVHCDEPITEGQDTADASEGTMHAACYDQEARCPFCHEPLEIDVLVRTSTRMSPSLDPELWNKTFTAERFDSGDVGHMFSAVDEDPSSFMGLEQWACAECGHVLWKKEEF